MREKIQRASALMYLLLTCVIMLQLFSDNVIFLLNSLLILAVFGSLLVVSVSVSLADQYKTVVGVYATAFVVCASAAIVGVGVGYLEYQIGHLPPYYGLMIAAFVGYVCAGSVYKTFLTARHIQHLSMRADEPSRKRARAAFESLDARLSASYTPSGVLWRFCKAGRIFKEAA